jgi:hypothetical protein
MTPADLVFIVFAAFVNRWRGGGAPGHLWGAPAIIPGLALGAMAAILLWSWPMGLLVAFGYIVWGIGGYGDSSMGRSTNPRAPWPWPIEHLITGIPGWPKEAAGMALRSLFAAPFFALVALYRHEPVLFLWLLPFAALVTGAYVLAWRLFWPGRWGIAPTELAEILTGVIWGGSILVVSHGL